MHLELPVVKHVQIARKEKHRKLVLSNVQIALSVDTQITEEAHHASHAAREATESDASCVQQDGIDQQVTLI